MGNFKSFTEKINNSIIFRIILIGTVILIMLIPFGMIMSLINERENRRKEVIREINSKWAFGQKVTGPVLDIPYRVIKETHEIE